MINVSYPKMPGSVKGGEHTNANMQTRVLEAEAEAVVFVSRFQIGGWDSY